MSNYTENLNFFKWDKQTDGTEKFDIDKALNENWDKADEGYNALSTAIGTLSSLNTEDKASLVEALNELWTQTVNYKAGYSINICPLLTDRTFDEIMGLDVSTVLCLNGTTAVIEGAGYPKEAYGYGLLITYCASSHFARTQIYIPDGAYFRRYIF